MKQQVVAFIITIAIIIMVKVILAINGVKHIFFQYNVLDANAQLYILFNWILNISGVVVVYMIIRYIQKKIKS